MRSKRWWAAALSVALLVPMTFVSPAGAADPIVVSSVDFEDGTTGDWTQSGGPTLTVIDDGGNMVLEVANRANDYDGIQSPTGILTPDAEYTFTMRAKLATSGTADMRFVVKPAYTWVGNTTVNGDDWTTVTGTYTAPSDGDPAAMQVYIGTGTHSVDGDTYTYLVDDIVLIQTSEVEPPPPPEVIVAHEDFEDGSYDPWVQSGSPTLTIIDDGGNMVLEVANRSNDYDGIKSPAGLLVADVEYTLSMRVKLATPGTADVRFVTDPNYNWIGNTTVNGDDWTTVTGTYTPSEAVAVFIGTGTHSVDGDTYTYLVDDILITSPPPMGVVLATDFEAGLDGWVARDSQGTPTVAVTTAEAHGGLQAALVSDRTGQGDGIGHDVTGIMIPGVRYQITAWVKMAAGAGSDSIWLSMQRVNDGADSFDTVGQFNDTTDSAWREVTATYMMAEADTAFLYFETSYSTGGNGDFLVDDVTIEALAPPVVQDLTPIKDTVDFNIGVAIDSRETTGSAAELLLRHFDQVTPENHMKPEAWYDADRTFRIHPEATAIMDFAQANGLAVYGHTLVWHSQTPAWFFEAADGTPLTNSAADQEILRQRLEDHIYGIAEALSNEYGLFGSETNPLVAWDVVNEVVSDGATDDGLRRSPWYNVLGEQYIDLAFQYADDAFNNVYADPAADRPVLLAINDYNTEQAGKRDRFHDVTARLIDRGVPIDIVGHQFHLNLSTPVQVLEDAFVAFEDLPVTQVVSELDVTTGTPVTEALLIDQGYYFRDAFRIFRTYTDDLFSVTVWGLTDSRSWRIGSGDPLVFDDDYQAKPAYYGIVDGELPSRQRTAFVFMADGELGLDAPEWDRLPLHLVDTTAAFQLRWTTDTLVAFVEVADATVDASDAAAFLVDGTTYVVNRDGSGDVAATVAETGTGWSIVASLPLPGAAESDLVAFDLQVTDGDTTVGWNEPGAVGTLTLVEALSYTEAIEAAVAPVIDGAVDDVWAGANSVTTDIAVQGTDGASAVVRTLWKDNLLYVLAEVTDATPDISGSDPWIQDSLEIFLDAGNFKNGPYRYDDTQIRINSANETSFGTGDVAFQEARLDSATTMTDTGYIVEASVSLLEYGGLGTFHGLDFQINDGTDGVRTSIRTWADPTGIGYQSTARWGVAQLVAAPLVCDTVIEGFHWGPVIASEGVTCIADGAVVRGAVLVRRGASLVAQGAVVYGPVLVGPGASLVAEGTILRGPVLLGPGASLVAKDARINGSIVASRADSIVLDGATVLGPISIISTDSVVLDGTTVRGPITIIGTTGLLEITDNSVRGTLALMYNNTGDQPIIVSGNYVNGFMVCLMNHPIPTDNGVPNTVTRRVIGQCPGG